MEEDARGNGDAKRIVSSVVMWGREVEEVFSVDVV